MPANGTASQSPLGSMRQMLADSGADLAWLKIVYEREYDRLWRAVLAWTGSSVVADDAAAEAFVQAARRKDLQNPKAWVWTVAFKLAAREMARQRALGELDPSILNLYDEPHSLAADTVDLLAALRELTDQQRGAVILTNAFDLSSNEVAGLLNTTPTTVRVQAMRARRKLRKILEAKE